MNIWKRLFGPSKIDRALAVAVRRAQHNADVGNASKDEAERTVVFHRANEAKEIADEIRTIIRVG